MIFAYLEEHHQARYKAIDILERPILEDTGINSYLCGVRFLSANKLFNGKVFLPDDRVLVLNEANHLKEIIGSAEVAQDRVEALEGIITPGFVNSHCHLELSHLKGLIPRHTGLPGFARQVITLRNKMNAEEKAICMEEADREMWNNGIVAVGDISNGTESFDRKAGSNIFYHTFIELIGLHPKSSGTLLESGLLLLQQLRAKKLNGSLAPHAPYSTSLDLIQKIAGHNRLHKTPFSIHNQESEEETKFFEGKESGFDELYQFLGLDTSWFNAPGSSSLLYYSGAIAPDTPSLLVHNTVTTKVDIASTFGKDVYWCLCPGANQYIEDRLPDLELFAGLENRICIGTDSLASNSQLDLVYEVNCISEKDRSFSKEATLRALTFNGAEALGISDAFGQLHTGKNAGLNLVAYKNSELRFLKKLS